MNTSNVEQKLRRVFFYLNKFVMVPMFRLGFGSLMGTPFGGYIMVLKVVGRKSGKVRYAPVNYRELSRCHIAAVSLRLHGADEHESATGTPGLLLARAAALLRRDLRAADLLYRDGADGLLAVLPHADAEAAGAIADRARNSLLNALQMLDAPASARRVRDGRRRCHARRRRLLVGRRLGGPPPRTGQVERPVPPGGSVP